MIILVVFALLQWSSLFESSNNTAVVLAFTSRSSCCSSDDARTTKLNHHRTVVLLRASSSITMPSSSSSSKSCPIERVAIIGGGVAGLSFANALLSSSTTTAAAARSRRMVIDMYESRSNFEYEQGGSGIQLTGGLVALRAISPTLQRQVCDASLPLGKVISHCRPWFSSSSSGSSSGSSKERKKEGGSNDDDGWKILELNVQQTIRDEHAKRMADEADASADDKQHALVTDDGEILAYTIMRGTLQRILHNHLLTEHYDGKECITFDKRLSGISYVSSSSSSFVDANDNRENNGNEQGIICEFDDGTKAGPYDIVVGCDGIRSVVKQYINTGGIITSSSSSSSNGGDGLAIYSGLRITFAIQDDATSSSSSSSNSAAATADAAADNPVDHCQYNQYFGNGAYALTSTYGKGKGQKPSRGAFLVYSDEKYIGPFRKKPSSTTKIDSMSSKSDVSQPDENPDWTQDDQSSREHVMSVLQSSQVPGYDAISDIVRNSDRFFDLGVFLHNPFSWNGWVREVVVQQKRTTTAATVDNGLSKNMKGLFGDSSNENTGRFVVTVGDASHAMPPFLGQGANQALQDSYTLAAKIHEYNTQFEQLQYLSNDDSSNTIQQQSDLKTLLKEYENRRWMPTTSITAKAAFLGYLEVDGKWFRDVFFFVMGKIGVVKKVFLDAATPKM